jgi:hypothetical protein
MTEGYIHNHEYTANKGKLYSDIMIIWLASGNVHKQKELAAILAGH